MIEVEHQPEQNRFVINVEQDAAVLDYIQEGSDIDFTRTYVPHSLRGRGYAEKLVHAGLAWAREHSMEIQASCWYVQKYLPTEEKS
jgi:hypothetical protein